jgi:periplasmic divalent cation tolerance protein
MNREDYVLLISTAGNVQEARTIARNLVSKHLVACVNIVPSIHSIYWWKDEVAEDHELLILIKSKRHKIPEIEKTIRSLHSYETPELIAVPLEYGLAEYLKWIDASLEVK